MSELNPAKLHVDIGEEITSEGQILPRTYTLTHSDVTGDLFLTIARTYNFPQISGLYTRLMRDEVLAQWSAEENSYCLRVYCHVSGGLILGSAGWRESIFRYHMPMVLEAFRFGDKELYENYPELDEVKIWVYFQRARSGQDKIEEWGRPRDYRINYVPV